MENLYLPAEPNCDNLTLSDDFLFAYAMQDLNICKEFLEILLNTKEEYMDYYLKQNELRTEALREGMTQGAAQQKAEDEKLLKETIAKVA